MAEPYISGHLKVVKRAALEDRYFRLYGDRLDYYKSEDDFREGIEPRGRVTTADIQSVHVTEEGFSLTMSGQEFALLAEGDAHEKWVQQLVRVCEEHSISITGFEDDDDDEEGSDEEQEEVIIKQGCLSVAKKNTLVERFFALTEESFTYWESEAEMEAGEDHRGMIEVGDISKFLQVDDGFDIYVKGLSKTLQLRSSSPKEVRDWIAKFAEVVREQLGDDFEAEVEQAAADNDSSRPSKETRRSEGRKSDNIRVSHLEDMGDSEDMGSENAAPEDPDDARSDSVVGEALPRPVLSDSERKLWEIFELSGKDAARTHYVTKGSFLETCRIRHLVADFFGLQRTPDGVVGMQAFDAVFDKVGITEGPKQKISWDQFRAFHRVWERRSNDPLMQRLNEIGDAGKHDLLHEGRARILQWPGSEPITHPAWDSSDFSFVDLDQTTGHARMISDFEYVKRPFLSSAKGSGAYGKGGNKPQGPEPPVATFARPDDAKAAIAEILKIWKRFYGPITVVYRLKAPTPSSQQGPEHQQWLHDFAMSRVNLVRTHLLQVGIPEPLLSTRVDAATDARPSAHHFEFDVHAPVRYIRICRGMMECSPDGSSDWLAISGIPTIGSLSVRAVHTFPGGFKLNLDDEQPVEVELLPLEDVAPWSSALNQLLEHGHRLRTTVLRKAITLGGMERIKAATGSPPTSAKHGPFERGSDFMNEASNPLVEEWLARLPEAPSMFGILGFQDRGSLGARFCVLFSDRLDCWDRPLDAANGKRHSSRIHLRDIKEFEIIGSGLVLTLVARKVGIHTRTYQDLYLWSEALRLQLQPPSYADGGSPRGVEPPLGAEEPDKTKAGEKKTKQDAKPNFPGRSIQDVPVPEWKKRTSIFVSKTDSAHWRHKQGKGVVVNTHKDGGEAMQRLHGVGDTKVLSPSSARSRNSPSASAPACKITESTLGRNAGATQSRSSKLLAEKVTGSRSGVLKSDNVAWVKINHIQHTSAGKPNGNCSKPGSPASPASAPSPSHRDSVAQKITDSSRAPRSGMKTSSSAPFKITNSKGRPAQKASQPRTFKITESGRGSGAAHNARAAMLAGSVDKTKSFGHGGRS